MKNEDHLYFVTEKDCVGLVPPSSIAKIKILFRCIDSDDIALVFFPAKLYYKSEGETKWSVEAGCGSLSFAKFDSINKFWILASPPDYINLSKKDNNKLLKWLK